MGVPVDFGGNILRCRYLINQDTCQLFQILLTVLYIHKNNWPLISKDLSNEHVVIAMSIFKYFNCVATGTELDEHKDEGLPEPTGLLGKSVPMKLQMWHLVIKEPDPILCWRQPKDTKLASWFQNTAWQFHRRHCVSAVVLFIKQLYNLHGTRSTEWLAKFYFAKSSLEDNLPNFSLPKFPSIQYM